MNDEQPILVVEDDDDLRSVIAEILAEGGYTVVCAADAAGALDVLGDDEFSLVLSDINMDGMDGQQLLRRVKRMHPELPVVLMTAFGSVEQAVQAIRDGANDYIEKPFLSETLLEAVARYARRTGAGDLIAEDGATLDIVRLAERVAKTDATVMINGESGSGKEVFARYIHDHSARADGPFVAINCAAIPESMLEAMLFGYEKGAFTGAHHARAGKFEQANGGTLLLDEVTEMDIALQAKLLRVLQEKEVERLGSETTMPVDVRVLATSNRNLREAVTDGTFREDLYYRLNVFPLNVPALRDRPADILPLARYFLMVHGNGRSAVLSSFAQAQLAQYSWPGNVRELENVIQRALILCGSEEIVAEDLHFEAPIESPARQVETGESLEYTLSLHDALPINRKSVV